MRIALCVAGSDPSGGAGLQLDLQVFRALGVHGAGVLTALTVQDTKKVHRVLPAFPSVVSDQLRVLLADVTPHAIKLGMLATDDVLRAVALGLAAAGEPRPPLLIDPLLRASDGAQLLERRAFGGLLDLMKGAAARHAEPAGGGVALRARRLLPPGHRAGRALVRQRGGRRGRAREGRPPRGRGRRLPRAARGQLGVQIPAEMLRRFWTMLTHDHGQLWNGSEIGASLGVTHHTTRKYLDLLTGGYVVRQLQPWFENLGKRVVKSPKVYVRDSGLLHALLGIPDLAALQGHPKLGASWEGFAIEQILAWAGERNACFWATHSRAELELPQRSARTHKE